MLRLRYFFCDTLARILMTVLGTIGELILLRHIDKPSQWIPIVLLTVAVPVVAWHARAPDCGASVLFRFFHA